MAAVAGFAGPGGVGTAIRMPGTAAINAGSPQASSVSCASAGNCTAGGSYKDGSGKLQPFVLKESGGVWGNAIEVPGAAALNTGGDGYVRSVSCGSAGNCTAGGFYTVRSGYGRAFVVNEVDGVWGTAIKVPGAAALSTGGGAVVASVSCASAANCTAGGTYADGSLHTQVFVVDETDGVWGTAIDVPGTGGFDTSDPHSVSRFTQVSVSCASVGNCAAGGDYADDSGHWHTFVANEVAGVWGTAINVPGTAVLNTGGAAGLTSVSCGSAGYCTAGGYYHRHGAFQAFVVNETDGVWGTAIKVPGTAALNTDGNAQVNSVSCASADNCTAGGFYSVGSRREQAFVVNETDGVWGTAIKVPGTAALNTGGSAQVNSVSCRSAGNCTAGGDYIHRSNHFEVFVVKEAGGVWSTAIKAPGTATLNTGGDAALASVSCASAGPGNCAAVGYYNNASNHQRAFVTAP